MVRNGNLLDSMELGGHMVRIQAWSQEPRFYEGNHDLKETVMGVTVEDVLWAMYTVNVKLTDANLEKVLGNLREGADLESLVESMDLEREDA